MIDDFKDNHSSHSIDIVRRRPNKKLEIIVEENNSFNNDNNNPDISQSKTPANYYNLDTPLQRGGSGKRFNSSEKRKRSEILHEKVKQILNYRESLNNIEPECDLDEKESKNEDDSAKKKIQKKGNKNLK